jgi:hypothetical protein
MTRLLKRAILGFGAVCLVAPSIAPATAQEWRREEFRDRERARAEAIRDREWREHERRAAEWRRMHAAQPSYGYAYAPPPVVYSPPPPAGFTLTIPFDVR